MTCTCTPIVALLETMPHFDVVYYNYSKNAQTLQCVLSAAYSYEAVQCLLRMAIAIWLYGWPI